MTSNGIAIIGAGVIGAAHANGYRTHLPRLASKLLGLKLAQVCDVNRPLAEVLAATYGFEKVVSDWREVLASSDISIVSICLPNFLHTEVMEAALESGKHVICEKPLANNSADAKRLFSKSQSSIGVAATVFNYRRVPAVTEIRNLIVSGDIGDPIHILVQFQAEYAADPLLPFSWRYERNMAGAGALLDVGTHAIDTARYLCGDVIEVAGAIERISIKERFVPVKATKGHGRVQLSEEKRTVDNDDVVSAILRFENGCQGIFSASRVATGMSNTLSFVVSGTKGTIRFTSERLGEYEIARRNESGTFSVVPNRPTSPFSDLISVPHDGVGVGYAESFGFMIHEFLSTIAEGGKMKSGSVEDGLRAACILDAIQEAIRTRLPVSVEK